MTDEPMTDQPFQDDTVQLLKEILTELRIIRFCVLPKNETLKSQTDELEICWALMDAVPAIKRAGEMLARANARNSQPDD